MVAGVGSFRSNVPALAYVRKKANRTLCRDHSIYVQGDLINEEASDYHGHVEFFDRRRTCGRRKQRDAIWRARRCCRRCRT
ncbi:hypothetical protein BCAR13_280031 [Paraburkholderia caribensis]|nr:hypothetical protein BCAR13_280031 [Paraburkholderia caribensis]